MGRCRIGVGREVRWTYPAAEKLVREMGGGVEEGGQPDIAVPAEFD